MPVLKRFELTVLKDTTGAPASATATFYKQGATVKTAFNFPSILSDPATIEVYDTGRIALGDTVKVFSSSLGTATLSVEGIPDTTHLEVLNSAAISGAVGDRLVVSSDQPKIYTTPLATDSGSTTTTSDGTTGRAMGYVREPRYDFIVSGTNVNARLYRDTDGGYLKEPINAADYPTLQAAIDACVSGGTVFVPAGTYTGSLTISKPVILLGEGRGTILKPTNNSSAVITVSLGTTHFYLRDVLIDPSASSYTSGGYGLKADSSSNPGATGYIRLSNVVIQNCADHGVTLNGVNFPMFDNVTVQDCAKSNFYLYNCAQVHMQHVYAIRAQDFGIYAETCSLYLAGGIGIENNQLNQTNKNAINDCQLRMKLCSECTIFRTDIEDFVRTTSKTGIFVEACLGVVIEGCGFNQASETAGSTGIYVGGGGGVTIGSNSFNKVEQAIVVEGSATATKGLLIGPQGVPTGTTGSIVLPSLADRDGKRMIAVRTGLSLAVYTTSSRPAAGSDNVGEVIYVSNQDGTNVGRVQACQQTGASTYSWVSL